MDTCIAGSPEVNARDLRRFISLMRAYFVNYEDSFLQHSEGLLDGAAASLGIAVIHTRLLPSVRPAGKRSARSAFTVLGQRVLERDQFEDHLALSTQTKPRSGDGLLTPS